MDLFILCGSGNGCGNGKASNRFGTHSVRLWQRQIRLTLHCCTVAATIAGPVWTLWLHCGRKAVAAAASCEWTFKEQNCVRNETYIICRKTTVPWYQSISFWKQSVSDWFVASLSMLASHLINSGYNPLLEQLDGFIKKYKQFIQSDITTDIVALTLILSTEGCGTSNFTIYFVDTSLFCFFYS